MPNSSTKELRYQARFGRIVDLARRTNPFYRRWITDPASPPVLTRQVFLENNEEILNGFEGRVATSGSTGRPVTLDYSPAARLAQTEDLRMVAKWLGGQFLSSQIRYLEPHHNRAEVLDIQTEMGQQIAFLNYRYQAHGVTNLNTYPTNGVRLADHILENGLDFRFMTRVGLLSEQFDPWQRELLQKAFPNALIWQNYGSMEFGMIGSQCPHEPAFTHLMVHRLRIEVLNDESEPCAEDEVGRVVITDYQNEQVPMIRYEIGDYAALSQCPCGKIDLPAFSVIHGKVRGTLVKKDGSRLFITALSPQLRDLPGVTQYQVIQKSLDLLIVKLVLRDGVQVPEKAVAKIVSTAFEGNPPAHRIEVVDEIPRSPNGKFHASICELDPEPLK